MTDFNYNEYPIEVLNNAISKAEQAIKDRKNKVRRYDKMLTLHNGRGLSNQKKHMLESFIKYAPALIAYREEEIKECQAEIANR